jgi:hypothetical protein
MREEKTPFRFICFIILSSCVSHHLFALSSSFCYRFVIERERTGKQIVSSAIATRCYSSLVSSSRQDRTVSACSCTRVGKIVVHPLIQQMLHSNRQHEIIILRASFNLYPQE